MTLVVDANVAIKWYVAQDDRQSARRVQVYPGELLAPMLLVSEVASGLWQHRKLGDITVEQAQLALFSLGTSFAALVPDIEIASAAFDLATKIDHSPYDCFYLALAEQRQAKLVTADQPFFDKLSKKRRTKHVVMLHQWSQP